MISEQNNTICFKSYGNERGNHEIVRVIVLFSESGAYNRAVLTLKVMSSEVVLTIELVLTIKRSYNRARTVIYDILRFHFPIATCIRYRYVY